TQHSNRFRLSGKRSALHGRTLRWTGSPSHTSKPPALFCVPAARRRGQAEEASSRQAAPKCGFAQHYGTFLLVQSISSESVAAVKAQMIPSDHVRNLQTNSVR